MLSSSYMEPWPMVRVKIIDWNTGDNIAIDNRRPGHLYIRCPFVSKIISQSSEQKLRETRERNFDWIPTNFIGFYDSEGHLQIIDHNDNFIIINGKRFSKTLIETIMMAIPSVRQATVLQSIDNGTILSIKPISVCSQEELQKQLECNVFTIAIIVIKINYLIIHRLSW